MQSNIARFQRTLRFFSLIILLLIFSSGCILGEIANRLISPDSAHPPEDPGPDGEARILHFDAFRKEIKRGECTTLEWHIEGGVSAHLNGQSVDFVGAKEVCPNETTTYDLDVDSGTALIAEHVTILILDSAPPDGGETPKEVQPQPTSQGSSPPPANPPALKATEPPRNCNKTETEFLTDLAITDIFADRAKQGQFFVRITNHGPVACQDVNLISLGCTAAPTSNKTGNGVGAESDEHIPVTLNISPGETQDIFSGLGFDFDNYSYLVTCSLGLYGREHKDPNMNNQYYQENFP